MVVSDKTMNWTRDLSEKSYEYKFYEGEFSKEEVSVVKFTEDEYFYKKGLEEKFYRRNFTYGWNLVKRILLVIAANYDLMIFNYDA